MKTNPTKINLTQFNNLLTAEDAKRLQRLEDIINQANQTQQDLINLTLEYFQNKYGFDPLNETDKDKK